MVVMILQPHTALHYITLHYIRHCWSQTQLLTCGRTCVQRKPSLSLSAPRREEEEEEEGEGGSKSEIRTEMVWENNRSSLWCALPWVLWWFCRTGPTVYWLQSRPGPSCPSHQNSGPTHWHLHQPQPERHRDRGRTFTLTLVSLLKSFNMLEVISLPLHSFFNPVCPSWSLWSDLNFAPLSNFPNLFESYFHNQSFKLFLK